MAPTPRRSRTNTGNKVVKGIMNNEVHSVMRSPRRTASVRQLNIHPSTMLWPKETPCVEQPRALVAARRSGRSCRVQTTATT